VKGKAVKAPAKPKIAATKSSSKGKSSSEKRILVDRNDNADDSDAEDNDQDAQGRDAQQRDGPAKKKTASEMYTKVRDGGGIAD